MVTIYIIFVISSIVSYWKLLYIYKSHEIFHSKINNKALIVVLFFPATIPGLEENLLADFCTSEWAGDVVRPDICLRHP